MKRQSKKILSVVLVLILALGQMAITVSVIGLDNRKDNVTETVIVKWEDKICESLWEMVKSADQDEKIPVWVWFADIDQQKVEN